MSIMLAAVALGIGSCHSAVGDGELARELFCYPADRSCELLISLGNPAGGPLAGLEPQSGRLSTYLPTSDQDHG